MHLKELLAGVEVLEDRSGKDVEISGICYDTRELKAGELFVALPGYKTDGHRFLKEAVEKGAAAAVCERAPEEEGPWITVRDAREALAVLSANWFGHPAKALTVLAVTGTNGKTTTTSLLKWVLERTLGARVGLIGTNQNMIGDEILPAKRTTPESYEVQRLLRAMVDAGCNWAVMEVSSHALVLRRVEGISFRAGVFTNLTQDHLDFHKSMEEYRRAKGLLFRQCDTAVLNLDDEAGRYYAGTVQVPKFTYSENKDRADLTAKNLRLFPDRVEFEAVTTGCIQRVRLPIPGGFSVYNALAVLACTLTLGIPLSRSAQALADAPGVKGRVEVVHVSAPYTVLIDYAHTPDALENVLTTVRDFAQGRVICLFGCGGDRDRSKRAVMGAIAASLSDLVIVTSDNPRTEEPEAIIDDILSGMEGSDTPRLVEVDRRVAIRRALELGKAGDVIVLAGKGHETYQEVGGERRHLDEREIVADYFAS